MTKKEFIAKYEGWFSYIRREELKKQMESDLDAVFQALRQPLVSGSLPLPKCKCGQNALPYKEQIEIDKCSVSGSYYLVRYCGGSYDDYYSAVIFVTNKKSTATKYVTKFNRILKKWKAYYAQFETDKFGMKWIADEHVEKHFDRWNSLKNITNCYYEEVSFR